MASVEGLFARPCGSSRVPVSYGSSPEGATVTRLTRDEIAEIYDIRLELEGLGARIRDQAYRRPVPPKDEDARRTMGSSLASPLTWIKLNNEFHMTLYQASGMNQLCDLIKDLTDRVLPYVHLYISSPQILEKTHPDHPLLYEAVAARTSTCRGDHPRASSPWLARVHGVRLGVVTGDAARASEISRRPAPPSLVRRARLRRPCIPSRQSP